MATWGAGASHLGTASLAGLIAGVLVGGLLGRVAMRISGFAAGPSMVGARTENGNLVGDITFGGTLALVIFVGVASGLLGGILYAMVEPWLRRMRPWHGLVYGVALLAAFGFTVFDPFNFDFTRFGPAPLNIVMFASLFVLFGVITAWLFDRLRVLPAMSGAAARAVDLLALFSLAMAGFFVAAAGVDGLSGNLLAGLLIFGALAVAALVRWRGLPLWVGHVCLVGALALGATRTIGNVLNLLYGF
ncbi:MAG TPA: hypothetical protein VJ726_05635 [Candidatus Limnocylindria bacterium]|nr:hypothetical protein [Candidatus Limnocylindria bacterium]